MCNNKYESASKTTLFTRVATTTHSLHMPTVGLFILSWLLLAIGVDYKVHYQVTGKRGALKELWTAVLDQTNSAVIGTDKALTCVETVYSRSPFVGYCKMHF